MLDNLTKTQYVDFHLIPRHVCGYINFVHNQGTLAHSAVVRFYSRIVIRRLPQNCICKTRKVENEVRSYTKKETDLKN